MAQSMRIVVVHPEGLKPSGAIRIDFKQQQKRALKYWKLCEFPTFQHSRIDPRSYTKTFHLHSKFLTLFAIENPDGFTTAKAKFWTQRKSVFFPLLPLVAGCTRYETNNYKKGATVGNSNTFKAMYFYKTLFILYNCIKFFICCQLPTSPYLLLYIAGNQQHIFVKLFKTKNRLKQSDI